MKNIKLTRNPYLLFLPFLILYLVIVLLLNNDVLEGDEQGYIFYANNLLHGYYSPPAPNIDLWWGPGYPILLMPFLFFKLPLISITLANAIFQYLSIVFLYKAMIYYVKFQNAVVFSLFWAFCYSSYSTIAAIYAESFSLFLISLFLYSVIRTLLHGSNKYLYLAGFLLGYLSLTKVLFGYVIFLLFFGFILLWLTNRNNINYRRSILIMALAILTTIPYLFYTYSITGRMFYWGNSGGTSLYWMTSPYENENGAWESETLRANERKGEAYIPMLDDTGINFSTQLLKLNHQKDYDEILKYKGVQKDDAYKKIAINNIKTHPVKYLKNISANISRVFFGIPNNFMFEHIILKIWYFAVLFTLMLFCFISTVINWRKIPYSVGFVLVIAFLYLAGISLLSAVNRYFIVILPFLLFWIAYIADKLGTLKIRFDTGDNAR
jgi:4-amino-4-deoxy-L-arabinose transferase-like glycosyltransferase